jgi:hypothetical protein
MVRITTPVAVAPAGLQKGELKYIHGSSGDNQLAPDTLGLFFRLSKVFDS